MNSRMLRVQVRVWCRYVVEQFVDAAIGEMPAAVTTLCSWFCDTCLVEFSKRLGNRVEY